MRTYASETCKTQAGRQRAVYERRAKYTCPGGLTKDKLTKNKQGKIVSKAKSGKMKRTGSKRNTWITATQKARKELGVTGFEVIRKGTRLYKRAKELQEKDARRT